MFFPYSHQEIRYYGRWGLHDGAMTATATGSKIVLSFRGRLALLHFDTTHNAHPMPHLWLRVDNGARVEVTLDAFIRIDALTDGAHQLEIIHKSAVEDQHRWHHPLVGKISFRGLEAEGLLPLPENRKKTIEFVGDSITEGVLIDAAVTPALLEQHCRPYQDDVCATYAYRTAENLGLEPYFMGYGAVGISQGGCGGVPAVGQAYPYCFAGCEKGYADPDFIVINHGANDRGVSDDAYVTGYMELLAQVRRCNPNSRLIVLTAFCGKAPQALAEAVANFNRQTGDDVFFIDATGWVPLEPLHPTRDGHEIISQKLSAILRKKYGL